jgi:hypothetical protein
MSPFYKHNVPTDRCKPFSTILTPESVLVPKYFPRMHRTCIFQHTSDFIYMSCNLDVSLSPVVIQWSSLATSGYSVAI